MKTSCFGKPNAGATGGSGMSGRCWCHTGGPPVATVGLQVRTRHLHGIIWSLVAKGLRGWSREEQIAKVTSGSRGECETKRCHRMLCRRKLHVCFLDPLETFSPTAARLDMLVPRKNRKRRFRPDEKGSANASSKVAVHRLSDAPLRQ